MVRKDATGYYCFQCSLSLNGRTQLEDHFGLASGVGKRHRRGVQKVQRAVADGTVLPIAEQGDPVWIIGAKNCFNGNVKLQEFACLACPARFKDWDDMVEHLSKPEENPCGTVAAEHRLRHISMSRWGKALARQGIRASSESCGHRGCQKAAVLTGACSFCEAVNLFCPEHSYCCVCHHWYPPSSVRIDDDFCPCGLGKVHCRPRCVCGVCAGTYDGPPDDTSIRLRKMCGENMITALEDVEGDRAMVCKERMCWEPSVTIDDQPRPQWQMLFQLSYAGGQYATELARLCSDYGVTGTSSGSYMVQGQSGRQFTLLFYHQPQLAPDADKWDFPMTVWVAQQGHAGPDTCENRTECSDWQEFTPTTRAGTSTGASSGLSWTSLC